MSDKITRGSDPAQPGADLADQITRYRVKHLCGMEFVRRPVTVLPKDGTLCFVDRGNAFTADRYSVGIFADGVWLNSKRKPMPSPPTFWTEMVKDD